MDSTTPSQPEFPPRQSSLDETKCRQILAIVANGGSRRAAAHAVGCHPSSITRLALRDPEFARQLADAQGALEADCFQTILSAAFKHRNRQAVAWLARHNYLSDFASRPLDAPILDRLADLLARLARMSLDKALQYGPSAAGCRDDSNLAAPGELDAQHIPNHNVKRALHEGAQPDLDRNRPPNNTSDHTHPPKPDATP